MSDRSDLIGTELSSLAYTVERGKIREMTLAIGDDNPLYTKPDYAKSQDYSDVITPPTFATCIDLWGGKDFMTLCRKLQMNPIKVLHGEQEYVYLGEIYPGDEIKATNVLKDIVDKGKMYIFKLETTYQKQTGENVLIARSTIIERK